MPQSIEIKASASANRALNKKKNAEDKIAAVNSNASAISSSYAMPLTSANKKQKKSKDDVTAPLKTAKKILKKTPAKESVSAKKQKKKTAEDAAATKCTYYGSG